jgi:hypothetical protein
LTEKKKTSPKMKAQILALFVVCLAAVAFCDSREDDGGARYVLRLPSIRSSRTRYQAAPVAYAPAPRPAYKSYDDSYEQPARYQFAYQAVAGGKGGYGDDSGEKGYGSSDTAEFGHAESRDGDNTKGKYFVQLPDGRLQTVEYYVNGDSGYIAKVSYDGKSESVEARY